MDLLYIQYDYRYWSKVLFSTIPTPAYDLEVKVTDIETLSYSFASKFLIFMIDKRKFRRAVLSGHRSCCLTWSHISEDRFSDNGAHVVNTYGKCPKTLKKN